MPTKVNNKENNMCQLSSALNSNSCTTIKHNLSSDGRRTTMQMAMVFLLLLITCQIVTSASIYDYGSNYENTRALYDLFQDNPNQFVHQMIRKGGRSPTLRLRFGRRSDPLWTNNRLLAAYSNNGNSGDDSQSEKMPYK